MWPPPPPILCAPVVLERPPWCGGGGCGGSCLVVVFFVLFLRFLMPTTVHCNHLSLDSKNLGSFHPYHCWWWPSLRRCTMPWAWAFLPAEEQARHQFTTLQIPDPQELQASKFPPVDNDSYPGSPAMGNLWSALADRLAGLLSWQ